MTTPTPEPDNSEPSAADPPPVEQQREELAETVDALTKKLDVPARVSAATNETVHAAAAKAKDNRQAIIGAVVAGALALGAIVVIRRRKS
jgi:hypothetical protein